MYKIMLLTPKTTYDITDRTELNFSLKFNESHKEEGSFSVRVEKGDVIPSYSHMIEVYDSDELIWFGNIIKVTKPSLREGNNWKVVTNNPESILANRIPLFRLESISVTDIVKYLYDSYIKYEIGWSEDTPTSRHTDIDNIDFTYFRFSNEENSLYKILDDLANTHNCWWAVHLYSGRPYFIFKKNGSFIGGSYIREDSPYISNISFNSKSDWCNRLRVEDGWINDDPTVYTVQNRFLPERFPDSLYVTELRPNLAPDEGIWSVELLQSEYTRPDGSEVGADTRGTQEVIRSIDPEYSDPDIGTSTLVYHTIGDKVIRLNTLFTYGSDTFPNYTYRNFVPESSRVKPGTYCILTVLYTKCRKYIKNYNESLPIGKYSGIIDRREKLEGVRFNTRAQGDSYSESLKEWYSRPQETITVKSDMALNNVYLNTECTLDLPSYGVEGDYLCTEISIEPKLPIVEGCLQRYCERTYKFSVKEPTAPAKLLRNDDKYYNKDVKPRQGTANTESFNIGDGYRVSKRFSMYVTSIDGTESNNGQMAVPLDLPLN